MHEALKAVRTELQSAGEVFIRDLIQALDYSQFAGQMSLAHHQQALTLLIVSVAGDPEDQIKSLVGAKPETIRARKSFRLVRERFEEEIERMRETRGFADWVRDERVQHRVAASLWRAGGSRNLSAAGMKAAAEILQRTVPAQKPEQHQLVVVLPQASLDYMDRTEEMLAQANQKLLPDG